MADNLDQEPLTIPQVQEFLRANKTSMYSEYDNYEEIIRVIQSASEFDEHGARALVTAIVFQAHNTTCELLAEAIAYGDC